VKKDESAVDSVKKMIAAQRGEFGDEERKGQKEITLGEDLEGPVRWVQGSGGSRGVMFRGGIGCGSRPAVKQAPPYLETHLVGRGHSTTHHHQQQQLNRCVQQRRALLAAADT
jgi:hypothetical protein